MSSKYRKISRREFLKLSGAGMVGILLGGVLAPFIKRLQQDPVEVMVFKETSYQSDLTDTIRRGISNYEHMLKKIKGGKVVLKPNLIDYDPDRPLNTHPAVVAAAIAAFRQLGAQEVIVAEGPGHNRDMEAILEQTGFDEMIRDERVRFVDLNIDAISPVKLEANYTGLSKLFFPHTILDADLLVSMPKLKTHHWTGVTLSLKNLFGTIPGIKYGWPKNFLHWYGISNSIADIASTLHPDFAIVDGIVGMEGDGPIHGTGVNSGLLVVGDNLTAVDSTATRLMGFYPEQIEHLLLMLPYGGTINQARIRQVGETLKDIQQTFSPPPVQTNITEKPSLWREVIAGGW